MPRSKQTETRSRSRTPSKYREFEATKINQLMNALTSKEQLNQLKTKLDDDCLSVLNEFVDKNALYADRYKILPPPEFARLKAKKAWRKWIDEYVGKIVNKSADRGECSVNIDLDEDSLDEYGMGPVTHEDHKVKALLLELLIECGYGAEYEDPLRGILDDPRLQLTW